MKKKETRTCKLKSTNTTQTTTSNTQAGQLETYNHAISRGSTKYKCSQKYLREINFSLHVKRESVKNPRIKIFQSTFWDIISLSTTTTKNERWKEIVTMM